jgi:hypothetical protein
VCLLIPFLSVAESNSVSVATGRALISGGLASGNLYMPFLAPARQHLQPIDLKDVALMETFSS